MGRHPMFRFVTHALPLLMLLLAAFGVAVDLLDLEPRSGSVLRLGFFDGARVPATVVLSAWLMESCGLLALFLIAQGRCGAWWLDGLVAGWLAWIFRGPLLVLTIVVATRQPQDPWWTLALGWWMLYTCCGLVLALLARRSELSPPGPPAGALPDTEDGDREPVELTMDGDAQAEAEAPGEDDSDRTTSDDGAPQDGMNAETTPTDADSADAAPADAPFGEDTGETAAGDPTDPPRPPAEGG